VDLSELRPETLDFINRAGALYQSRTVKDFMKAYHELRKAYPDEEAPARVMEDVLQVRNGHLLGELEQAVGVYPVVIIPWGALHLPEIEAEVKRMGYRPNFDRVRKVLSFW
jgi:hypothetical protein